MKYINKDIIKKTTTTKKPYLISSAIIHKISEFNNYSFQVK